MPLLTHKSCDVRLVPSLDRQHLVLLNCCSEEQALVSSSSELRFTEEGWAFITSPSSQNTWVKQLLPSAVASTADGKEYIAFASGTRWRKDMMSSFVQKYPSLALEKDDSLSGFSVRIFEGNRSGMYCFWDLRAVQAVLHLQLSDRYASQWLGVNSKSWEAYLTGDLKLPEHCMVYSEKSKRKNDDTEIQSPYFACSTVALLSLCFRWQNELKKQPEACIDYLNDKSLNAVHCKVLAVVFTVKAKLL